MRSGDRQTRQMLMKRLETNAGHRRGRASGFSLIEMTMVVALTIVVSVVSVISLVPLLKAQHVTNAYNTTLTAMRQARDNAVSQRTSYEVSFVQNTTPPIVTTIQVIPTLAGGFTDEQNTVTYLFPNDVEFLLPPTGTPAPDSYGTGANMVDFGYTASSSAGGQTIIYFCPDGSAQTSSACSGAGYWDGGVVYFGQSGNTGSYRAVDLWGGTGRVHGWRLYPAGTGYQWLRQ